MLRTLAFSLTVFCSASALSGTACPQHFVAGQSPVITNTKFQARTQEICFLAFAVLHSGVSRTPLYAAEHLTRENLKKAKALSRKDSFHAEDALPKRDRAELDDYARSGYDRGHMAPNADFANRKAQAESFSLANMVPQVHANNAGVWAGIEGAARGLATGEGELYVITGPAFIGSKLKKIGNVLVPTHLWKVIYSPAQKRAGAYLVKNEDTQDYEALTVAQLEKKIGVSLLPGMPQKIRDAGMALPEPAASSGPRPKSQKTDEVTPKQDETMLNALLRFVRQVIEELIGRSLKN
ncbi:MAG: DNA/RNA non-specific endonuclease [Pseudomonadota bacterium]|nr:DNA/RNA non-specific endonuclease [Pseudomonadota bacterium]